MNIYEEMRAAALSHAEKNAIIMINEDGSKTEYTYEQSLNTTDEYAEILERAGAKQGDRIGISAESRPEWNFAFMACAKLRTTPVLIDYSLTAEEIVTLVKKAQLSALLCSNKVIEKVGLIYDTPMFNICKKLELVNNSTSEFNRNVMAGNKQIGVIIFSSGTTKTASGIMHTHDSQIKSCRMVCETNGITEDDRYFGILPNSHIYGLFSQVIAPMTSGATVGFISALNAKGLTSGFEVFKPTILPAVPKIYDLLKSSVMKTINANKVSSALFKKMFPVCLKARKATGANIGRKVFKKIHDGFGGELRILCSAGSPMSKDTFEFFYGTGFNIRNNYGATETSIPTIGAYKKNIPLDCCGRTYPPIKMKIDASGEMLIKSPYLMLGYFNDKQSTDEAFTADGWFRTGDLGKYNKNKNIVILGRCKENIVLATGKKVAPDDIESAYRDIANIDELVVCGVPVDDGSYDEVHAFVVCNKIYQTDIEDDLNEKSAGLNQAMKLSGIHFVDSIPRTAIGKPKRYLLKKLVMNDSIETLSEVDEKKLIDSTDIPLLVRNAVAKIAHVSIADVKMSSVILHDFTIDSLSVIELALEIEEFSGIRIDDCIDNNTTVGRLVTLIQNPNRIKKTTIKSMLYPLDKRKVDYHTYRFYRNLVRAIYEVKVDNENYLPNEDGYIICANHVSNFDFMFLTTNFRYDRFAKFCCMAKKELFKDSFVNKLIIRVGGMVPVDRGGQVSETMNVLKDKLTQKWGVLVHPEGTRSKTGKMGEFKSGAALLAIEANVPIVPAYIKGGHEIFPPDKKLPNIFDWKRIKKYKVHVIYGKPIYPNGESAEELMESVKKAVTELSESV